MTSPYATLRPRVKICCISSLAEARMAAAAGAAALGLVAEMPSGPGVISEALIAEIAADTPPPIATFLLTSLGDTREIVRQHRHCRTNTIQLCDWLTHGTYRDLREGLPGIALVQVVHVRGPESLEEALLVAPEVDALLLDSGNLNLAVKELGGTGRRHDWAISRKICEQVKVPVFLAGGLNADNVREAIQTVKPYGLDLCSSVRSAGALDPQKLELFFERISADFAQ